MFGTPSMWTPMWLASFESCSTDASQTLEIYPSLGWTCLFHEHLNMHMKVTSARKLRSRTPKSVARVFVTLANACTQRSPACARRGHLYVLLNQQFLGLPCKRRGRDVLVNLSRRLFFGPRADEEAGRLRDKESKNFIMWICNACHTVSPTLTATDTTVPGMGDLRNGDMSSWIRESIH